MSDDVSRMSDDKLLSLRADLGDELRILQSQTQRLRARMDRVKKELAFRDRDETMVTDHAVVRYLERIEGRDIDALRATIRQIAFESEATDVQECRLHESGNRVIMNLVTNTVITILRPEDEEI